MRIPIKTAVLGSRRSVLSRAAAAWQFKDGLYQPATDEFVDITGHGIGLRMGSAVGADTNDPLRLLLGDGGKRVYLPGATSNNIRTPNAAALNITENIDLDGCVAPTAWTGASQTLVAKENGAPNRQYQLYVGTDGKVRLAVSFDGTAFSAVAVSTATVPFSAGVAGFVRATRIAATGVVTFYTSLDGKTWTQLGDVVAGTAGSIYGLGTGPLEIGGRATGTTELLTGGAFSGRVYAGLRESGGTLVADFDATKATEPYATTTDSCGNVWTFHRSASGRKLAVVDRDMLLLGGDDYLEAQDNALLNFGAGQPFTSVAAFRRYGGSGTTVVMAKRTSISINAGWIGYMDLTNNVFGGLLSDGTNHLDRWLAQQSGVSTLGAIRRGGGAWNVTVNSQPSTSLADTVVSATNAEVFRIGRLSGGGGNYFDGEVFSTAIFREALSQTDLQRLAAELGVAA